MTENTNKHHLVLGGARSGKSRYAENLIISKAKQLNKKPKHTAHYIATAQALDEEMRDRIKRHQADRQQTENNLAEKFQWQLIEEPIELGKTIQQFSNQDVVLIECLTLWLSNCLHHKCLPEQKQALLASVKQSTATIVFVSNEVGQGVVPMNALSREFIDESGWLHQELAKICASVTFVTAGLAQQLK